MLARSLDLSSRERRAFKLHLSFTGIEGVIAGVLALNEFVFIKSLKGSNYQLAMLFSFSMVVFLLLFFVNRRSHRWLFSNIYLEILE